MRIHVVVGVALVGAALFAGSAAAFAEAPVTAAAPPATPAATAPPAPAPPASPVAGAPAVAAPAAPTAPAQVLVDAGASVTNDAGAAAAPDAGVGTDGAAGTVAATPQAKAPEPTDAAETKAGGAAASYTPTEVGFSFGIRAGYSVPFGAANGSSLSSVVQGVVPIGVEAGWFFNPHLYVGGYFYYGFGVGSNVANDLCDSIDSSGDEETCTATMLRMGLVAHWHFRPETQFDPWVGAGLGYDIINLEAQDEAAGTLDGSASLHGFIVNIEGGLDFKPLPYLGMGPYVELATGHYSSDSSATSLHEWLSFGLRFRTNL